jgi:hypothetical protein
MIPSPVSLLVQSYESHRLFQAAVKKNRLTNRFVWCILSGETTEVPNYQKEGFV